MATTGMGFNTPRWIGRPLTHITPMSLSDGATFERKLDWVYNYITNTLLPELDGKLDEWFEQYKKDLAEQVAIVDALKDQWQALFDQFMADVVAQLEALNDQAAANLVGNESSKLREALDLLLSQRSPVIDARLYTDNSGDDTAGIQLAINDALAQNLPLYLPKDYNVTGNLTAFWLVDKIGGGGIYGNAKFPATPMAGESLEIYINGDTGSDSNDGLSASTPVKTLAVLDGRLNRLSAAQLAANITVHMAGSISNGHTFRSIPQTARQIVFQGEPLIGGAPKTSINYVGGGETFGIRFEPGGNATVNNVAFNNFPAYGLIMKRGGRLVANDCTAKNCMIGFAAINNVDFTMTRCYANDSTNDGFRAQYSSSGAWQYCRASRSGVDGFHISRNAVAHLDYSITEDNAFNGLKVDMASRAGCIGTNFRRNGYYGIRAEGASEFRLDDTVQANVFNHGTSDANSIAPYASFGVARNNALYSLNTRNEFTLQSSYMVPVHTGRVDDWPIIVSPSGQYIPPNMFLTSHQKLRVKFWGRVSAGTGVTTIGITSIPQDGTPFVRLVTFDVQMSGSQQTFIGEVDVTQQSSTVAVGIGRIDIAGQARQLVGINRAHNAAAGSQLRLYVKLDAVESSVNIDGYEVYLAG